VQKLIFHLNKELKFTKLQLSDYEKFKYFKRSFLICGLDDINSLLLFKQPSFFKAYTTAIDSLNHSLEIGLLPSAIGWCSFCHFPSYSKINVFAL